MTTELQARPIVSQHTMMNHPIRRVLLGVMILVAGPSSLEARQESPPPAYSVGLAYHSDRGQLLLFGGYFRGQYFDDTWIRDDETWTNLGASGPIARNAPAVAYDSDRHTIVLFGGDTRATGVLGDTWLWDGERWSQAAESGPPARTTHALAYDASRRRMVLFGGFDGAQTLGDTWEWDGHRWALAATEGPSPRTLHGLAYDVARRRVVLFGGTGELDPDIPPHGDTWEWDGTRWTRTDVEGPSPRDHVAMAYDRVRQVVVLHGGGTGPETRETWTYDGLRWTRVSTSGPARRFARLVFDSRSESMLLYGGFDDGPSNELWKWDGSQWERLFPR